MSEDSGEICAESEEEDPLPDWLFYQPPSGYTPGARTEWSRSWATGLCVHWDGSSKQSGCHAFTLRSGRQSAS